MGCHERSLSRIEAIAGAGGVAALESGTPVALPSRGVRSSLLLPLAFLEAAVFVLLSASGNMPDVVVTLFRALLAF